MDNKEIIKRKRIITTIFSIFIVVIAICIIILMSNEKIMDKLTNYISLLPHEEITTDINDYNDVIRVNDHESKYNKYGMNEEIMPESIDDLKVDEFFMDYYNPFDKQFLSYLTIDYNDDEKYNEEKERLKSIGIDDYKGIYFADGFNDNYTLLAMTSHYSYGFIYAIEKNDEKKITYVELIIPNFFYDLNYKNLIKEEYLPLGFDATPNNKYREIGMDILEKETNELLYRIE